MNVGKTLFSQVMEFVPWKTFGRIIERHKGDAGVRTLGCADLFRVMAFSQLTWRESLRDIEACLAANQAKLFHMGLKVSPARSTLADALNLRDWRIYHALAQRLIARAKVLYSKDPTVLDLDASVYALDSTTIDLCLSLFDGGFNDPLGSTAVGGTTNALTLGYAVASSDGGHSWGGLDGSFGLDPQARVDYGYNALGTLTPLAKNIVSQYYGTPATRSYYAGCSKGGQSGMVAAARFADQFDGIIAGDPGFNLPKAAVEELYDNQQFATVNPNIAQAFSPADLALVSSSILAKCDALDGAVDGIVSDVPACKAAFNFTTDVPQCASGATPDGTCLSAVQKTALANIYAGAHGTSGDLLYSDWPWDPGLVGSGWTSWKTFLNAQIAPVAMGNVFATPPAPVIAAFSPATTAYWQAFDVNQGFQLIYGTNATFTESAMSFMTPPNPNHLTTLKAKSKLIVYHGTGDPVFSSNDTTNWYNNLQAADTAAASYARLLLVPGMNHCGGGPATDNFDMLSALVSWVEQGTAPDTVKATVAAGNADKPASWSATRSRPLCAYPKKAVLVSGATDLESASSFSCQ